MNPDPWPPLPSSTTNNSREQHGTVVGCSYLRTIVSEAVQQNLRVGGNCDLVPIRPCDRLYQCHTDVEHSKQLCVEVKVHSSKYRVIHRHIQSRVMFLFPFSCPLHEGDLDRAKSSGLLSFDPKLHRHLVCARLTLCMHMYTLNFWDM